MDLNFLKDVSFGVGALALMFYGIRAFVPIIRTAIEKIPAAIAELTNSNNVLIATMRESQQESRATTSAIAGLADTTSLTGIGQTKALDLIATSLNTAMDRQQQYGKLIQEANNTGTQTLASVLAVGGQIGGMEEMVGEVLKIALDMQEAIKGLADQTSPLKPEDLSTITAKLGEVEQRLLDAIKATTEPHKLTVPPNVTAYEVEVEKKEEVKP